MNVSVEDMGSCRKTLHIDVAAEIVAPDYEKVLAVPVDALNPYYVDVKEYTDLPKILLDQITHFFSHYKDLEVGKWRIRILVRICLPGFARTWTKLLLSSKCRRWKGGR